MLEKMIDFAETRYKKKLKKLIDDKLKEKKKPAIVEY